MFTNHVIEQLPGHTRQALDCLLHQRTLLAALTELAAQGRAEILEARLLGYSLRLTNASVLIRWRPAGILRFLQAGIAG